MRTVAVEVDDGVFERAERKALALDTSVSDVLVIYLQQWAEEVSEKARMEQARQELKARFAKRDWTFAVGTPDTREQRNARR